MNLELIENLKDFENSFIQELTIQGTIKEIPEGTELLKEGQFIKVIPIVLKGSIKVLSRNEEKDFLLYYIKQNESCIMSISAALNNEKSKITAITEENSILLLIPADKIDDWTNRFPSFNKLLQKLYYSRYTDLVETINLLLFSSLEDRILDYLKNKTNINTANSIKISHRKIATDLGSSREVITRIMKKLENKKLIEISENGIKIPN